MLPLECVAYDAVSGAFTWKVSRGTRKAGAVAGVIDRKDGYVRIQINGISYLAHRLAWLSVHGRWPGSILDHKNGCRADNRIENIRLASREQNAQNSRVYSNSPVGLRGVTRSGNRWRARITVGHKQILIGVFATKEEASAAYQAVARECFDEFYKLGEPA